MAGINQKNPIDKAKCDSTEVSRQLISLFESSSDPWGVKNLESRYLYANPAHFTLLNLSAKFDIEGLLDSEIPHPIAEFESNFQEHDRKVQELQKSLASLDIYPYGCEQRIQPCICEKYPLNNEHGECIGVIFQIKKLHVFSAMQYINGELPSSMLSYPPEKLFTERELEVIFFVLQSLTCKEIARRLHLSHRTIENKLQEIYRKANINSLNALREFCRTKGYDKYIPPRLLFPGSQLINPDFILNNPI